MLLLLALACTEPDAVDTAAGDTGDTGTDETGSNDTVDTVEEDWCAFDDAITDDPVTATISAPVLGHDGAIPEGLEVQACMDLCIQGWTDSAGVATFTDMAAGCYKVDALGDRIEGGDYGRIRVFLEVAAGQATVLPDGLYLPKVSESQTISSGSTTFGDVTWTVDPSTIAVPFGYDDNVFSVGHVAGADVPDFWAIEPAGAVAFLPLASEVGAPFDLVVVGDYADGPYDVWAAGEHGELTGPIGSATASGGTLTASGIEPEFLTWILFSSQ